MLKSSLSSEKKKEKTIPNVEKYPLRTNFTYHKNNECSLEYL